MVRLMSLGGLLDCCHVTCDVSHDLSLGEHDGLGRKAVNNIINLIWGLRAQNVLPP